MTLHFGRSHFLLFVALFIVQLYGLWFSIHHAIYLQDFVHHTTSAAQIALLLYFSATSAFLTTAIIAKLLDATRP